MGYQYMIKVNNRYSVIRLLNSNETTFIYEGIDLISQLKVAIKFEHISAQNPKLKYEAV